MENEAEGGLDPDGLEMNDYETEDTVIPDPTKVVAARAEEVAYMHQRGLWEVVPIPPGVWPVSMRWVDVVRVTVPPAVA